MIDLQVKTLYFGSPLNTIKENTETGYRVIALCRGNKRTRIDKEENLLVNGGVYDDIVEYNNTIRWYRKWGRNNFWVGCFNPAPIDELEYIDLYKGVS